MVEVIKILCNVLSETCADGIVDFRVCRPPLQSNHVGENVILIQCLFDIQCNNEDFIGD